MGNYFNDANFFSQSEKIYWKGFKILKPTNL